MPPSLKVATARGMDPNRKPLSANRKISFANLTVLELEFRPLQASFSGNPVETAKEGNRESTQRTKEPPCSSTRSLPDASPAGMR